MCTQSTHAHTVATAFETLLNPRPWHDAGLEIAECPICMSTLAREVDFTDEPPTAVESYEPIGREATRQRNTTRKEVGL